MSSPKRHAAILVAEDDHDDYLLIQKAFEKAHLDVPLVCVKDGVELMDLLLRRVQRKDGQRTEGILLILLDLNMPRKDGREALKEIKAHPKLKHLPVVVLTTSGSPEEVALSYGLGANSFIRKPSGFADLVKAMAALKSYWLDVVELPRGGNRSGSHGG